MKRIIVLSLVAVATLFAQNASATLLPFSSHYEGSVNFSVVEYDLFGHIDFAVYDSLGGNEFVNAGFESPGTGRYTYAYQIFNDDPFSDETIAYFAIFGIGEPPLDVDEESIGSEEDSPDSGVGPTGAYCTGSNSRGVWEFKEQGAGILYAGDHSWFLVLSSDKDWVPGTYEIKSGESDFPSPPVVPEPGTLILLGLGGAVIFAMRRRKFLN